LGLAAPPNLQVDVFSIEDGIKALNEDTSNWETTMVLLKSPLAAKQLYDGGLEYDALNIGGIGSGPGRKNIFKNIAVSEEEVAILKYLMSKGVEITLLTVPGEKSKSFSALVNKL
jgi:mannose/fructose/N-acetylgalactosamine-specific phosphotransferase system component IIB